MAVLMEELETAARSLPLTWLDLTLTDYPDMETVVPLSLDNWS